MNKRIFSFQIQKHFSSFKVQLVAFLLLGEHNKTRFSAREVEASGSWAFIAITLSAKIWHTFHDCEHDHRWFSHTHAYPCSHTHTLSLSLRHTRICSLSRPLVRSQAHTHTFAVTHTHSLTFFYSVSKNVENSGLYVSKSFLSCSPLPC